MNRLEHRGIVAAACLLFGTACAPRARNAAAARPRARPLRQPTDPGATAAGHPDTFLFRYPDNADPARGFVAAKAWFNCGVVQIDEKDTLHITVINTNGATLSELSLEPQA